MRNGLRNGNEGIAFLSFLRACCHDIAAPHVLMVDAKTAA